MAEGSSGFWWFWRRCPPILKVLMEEFSSFESFGREILWYWKFCWMDPHVLGPLEGSFGLEILAEGPYDSSTFGGMIIWFWDCWRKSLLVLRLLAEESSGFRTFGKMIHWFWHFDGTTFWFFKFWREDSLALAFSLKDLRVLGILAGASFSLNILAVYSSNFRSFSEMIIWFWHFGEKTF